MIRMWVKFMPFILVEYVATKMGKPYQVSDKMVFLTVEDWRNLDALRAELAAANERAEKAEGKIGVLQQVFDNTHAIAAKAVLERDAANAEIVRLRELVRTGFFEAYELGTDAGINWQYRDPNDEDAWNGSHARAALEAKP